MICSACSDAKGDDRRIPRGWHRTPTNQVLCAKCWGNRYVLRAVSIPVSRPLGEGIGWPEFREALSEAWAETTACVNWMNTQLYVRDEQRRRQEKMPKMPKVYLYPEATKQFPDLPAQAVASIEQAVKRKYMAKRFDVLWTCSASLPNARYPQPAISHNANWRPSYEPSGKDGGDNVPCVTVTLLRGQRFVLRLQGGREFRRQLRDFALLVDGSAVKGELAILRKPVGGNRSGRRNGITERDSGGQKFQSRVVIKMVGWFPRSATPDREGILYVRTDTDCCLVALDEKANKLRIWNADHVCRWIAEHRRQLQRWSDDQKCEQRKPRKRHASFQSRREAAVRKYKSRMNSFIQETASQIAGVAKRMKFATVQLDTSYRGYFGEGRFEWSAFETYLAQRLNQDGIALTSGKVTHDSRGPLEAEV